MTMEEANFDNRKGLDLKSLNIKPDCRSVSVCNCAISSLDAFPSHAKLEKLKLMDNKISSINLFETNSYPALKYLDLSNNRIASLNDLQPLKKLTALTHINLMENKVCNVKGFKDEVFKLVPNLQSLDGIDRNGKEVPELDSDEGEDDEDDDEEDAYESEAESGEENGESAVAAAKDNEEAEEEDDEEDIEDDDEDEEDEEDEVGDDDGPGLKFLIEGDIGAEASEDDEDYQEEEEGARKRKAAGAKPSAKKQKAD
ncbi:hypothetical protein BC829DRAFT_384330 [Chytridium lagenaria]|nr:hypothetical protein BC829DRAFT_384330 [Chytridium lagenaria]